MKTIHHLALNAYPPAKQPNEIVGYLPTPFIEKRFHFLFDYNNDEIIVENQEGRICARYYIPSLGDMDDIKFILHLMKSLFLRF